MKTKTVFGNMNQLLALLVIAAPVYFMIMTLLTGCDDPQQSVQAGGDTTVYVDSPSDTKPSDPTKTVCDPFQNNSAHMGYDSYHGIVGTMTYLPDPANQQQYMGSVFDLEEGGTAIDATMFFSDLNVPTRNFDLGFVNQDGTTLLNQDGNTLYEYFALHFETQIALTANDPDGAYQFALLSDDGSVMQYDLGAGFQTLIDNDGTHPTKFINSRTPIQMDHTATLPVKIDYYQGPRYQIAMMLLWRPWPTSGSVDDSYYGQYGNPLYFNYNTVPSTPNQGWLDLVSHGWKPVSPANFLLPTSVLNNPCISPAPSLVSATCSAGSFQPKNHLQVGLAINSADSAYSNIVAGFQSIGVNPITYSAQDVKNGKPTSDGTSVLAISRIGADGPVDPALGGAVANYITSGGSVVAEYDGAALMFSSNDGNQPIDANLQSPFALYTGDASGGGIVLPLANSTMYVADPQDPVMAGVPSSQLNGVRSAFALSGYDATWLHEGSYFIATGTNGTIPAGTWPAELDGRCGSGRVVIFPMTHFQVINQSPVNTMVSNALHWVTGL